MSRVSRIFAGLNTIAAASAALIFLNTPALAQTGQTDVVGNAAVSAQQEQTTQGQTSNTEVTSDITQPVSEFQSVSTLPTASVPWYLAALSTPMPAAEPGSDTFTDPVTGRHMIFRIHVDAAHVEWNETSQNLEVGVMEGEIKPENYRRADQVAIRLGPDADMDGDEVTRFMVPNDPAYQFLGKPGTIWWNAAMQWNPNAGVFAGIGAGILPDMIQPESVSIALVGVEGPGDLVVFNNNATGIRPRLDSRGMGDDTLGAISGLSSGAHGHYNWAFSQPGRYVLKVQASAMTTGGQLIQGPTSEVLWLVGTDSDVGLPEGTTPSRTIVRTVEQMAAEQVGETSETPIIQPGQLDDEPEQPGAGTGDQVGQPGDDPGQPGGESHDGSENSSEQPGTGSGWEGNNSGGSSADGNSAGGITNDVTLPWKYTCAVPDHYDLMAQAHDDQVSVSLLQGPEGTTTQIQSRSIVMPVPDTASTVIDGTNLQALGPQGTRIWALPETQDPTLVWSGLNTGDVDYGLLDDGGVELKLGYVSAPQRGSQAGRMVMWDYPIQTGLRVLMDSADTAKTIRFPEHAHRHMATSFDMPGLYEADFGYWVTYNQQTMERFNLTMPQNYNSFTMFYAVGNQAIEQACPGYLEEYGLNGGPADGQTGEGAVQPPQAPSDPSAGSIGGDQGSGGLGDSTTGSNSGSSGSDTGSSGSNNGSSSQNSDSSPTNTGSSGSDAGSIGSNSGSSGSDTGSSGSNNGSSSQSSGSSSQNADSSSMPHGTTSDGTAPGTGSGPGKTGGSAGLNAQQAAPQGQGAPTSQQAPAGGTTNQTAAQGGNPGASQGMTSTNSGTRPFGTYTSLPNLTASADNNGLLAQTGSGGLAETGGESAQSDIQSGAHSGAQSGAQSGASAGLNVGGAPQSGMQLQSGVQSQSGVGPQSGANSSNAANSPGQELSKTGLGENNVWIVVALWAAALVALIALIVERLKARRRNR